METKWIHELFHFTAKERNGIIFLLLFILILIVIGQLYSVLLPNQQVDKTKWKNEVNRFLEISNDLDAPVKKPFKANFDPNRVEYNQLIELGVPMDISANWIKYINKGGKFLDKHDVMKIFGMTETLFNKLDTNMIISKTDNHSKNRIEKEPDLDPKIKPESKAVSEIFTSKKNDKPTYRCDLNIVDSAGLVQLKGIGPVFASRIIKYRNLLGGYCSIMQLKEIYGMRDENYTAISQFFAVDSLHLSKLNINFSTVKELGRHPYIGFRSAKKIIKLRDDKGKINSADELRSLLSPDSLVRLSPYLKF